jgi:hypothetical protein
LFIGYTDASVKNKETYLAFVVVFEDKSVIRKKIVVDEPNNNIAEVVAFFELLSFLKYYKFNSGLILFDSNGLKTGLRNRRSKFNKYIPRETKDILSNLHIRTQVIPRKYNIAHRVFNESKSLVSNSVSLINRSKFDNISGFPQYFMQPSVLEEYRQIYNKRFATFHEAQMKMNKKIWLADLIVEVGDVKLYEIKDKRIKVHKDTIVKLIEINHTRIGNHWRVVKRARKLKELIGSVI